MHALGVAPAAILGGMTWFFAATASLVQNDWKRSDSLFCLQSSGMHGVCMQVFGYKMTSRK
jgi:hypothetical protein